MQRGPRKVPWVRMPLRPGKERWRSLHRSTADPRLGERSQLQRPTMWRLDLGQHCWESAELLEMGNSNLSHFDGFTLRSLRSWSARALKPAPPPLSHHRRWEDKHFAIVSLKAQRVHRKSSVVWDLWNYEQTFLILVVNLAFNDWTTSSNYL